MLFVMQGETERLFLQDENAGTVVGDVKAFENTCYALHLEFQPKVKTANEIFNLIISRYSSSIKAVWNFDMLKAMKHMRLIAGSDEGEVFAHEE
ncbi:hypothetical protein Bca52824_039365 [Brassica carinata]|uniref:Uncharacterized protein n=1 Tax=Brassica carinata TaxID=52824 RepID=A0A8X7UWT8_BRACI|nr:hypothetical protein Bca52824_039365 [Brassica carinata]